LKLSPKRGRWSFVEQRLVLDGKAPETPKNPDYAAAISATKTELTVIGRGQFAGKLIRVDRHRLWMPISATGNDMLM
jgi:hypothetical protein